MPSLKHDSQGFLLGTPIQIEDLLKSSQAMADDIRAIKGLLSGGQPSINRSTAAKEHRAPQVALPVIRYADAKNAPREAANDAPPAARVDNAVRSDSAPQQVVAKPKFNGEQGTAAEKAVASAASALRAANGRFVKGGANHAQGDAPASGGEVDSSGNGVIARLVDAVKSAGNAEDADPAIKAMNEVARPMARGYELIAGDSKEKKQERWYRRFWQHMRGRDEREEKNNRLVQKGITALIEKPVVDGRARSGFLPLLLVGLKALFLGLFSKFLPKAMLGEALGGAGLPGGGGAAGKGGGAKARGGLKGMLKRIPLLGTALTLLGGASAAWASESSDMSRSEKDKATGSAVGGAAGTFGGMLAGAKLGAAVGALGGPIGVAIGGVVGGAAGAFFGDKAGQLVGETVGGWVASLRDADLPGKFMGMVDGMSEGFSRAMESLSAGWRVGIEYLGELKDKAASFLNDKLNAANGAVKDLTGIDVKAGFTGLMTQVKAVADSAQGYAKAAAKTAGNAISQSTVGRGVSAVTTAVKNQWKAGDRKKALIAQMDAQGIKDKNERAMLLAQVDHESDGFTAGEESFNYRSADRIMQVSKSAAKYGKPAIEAAMKQGPEAIAELMYGGRMGNSQPGDGYKYRGRGSIQITGKNNYEALGKKLGIDLVNNPDALLDPEISAKASVQWWKDNKAGVSARAGDVEANSRKVNGGTNGLDHRKALFAKYSADTASVYSGGAVQVAGQVETAPPVQGAISAHAPVISVASSSGAKPAAVAAAPSVPTAVATSSGNASNSKAPLPAISQDLTDRRLAHVATGGIGGAA